METRFGVKDFVLYALIVGLGLLFVLGRQQYDRQYVKIQQLVDLSSEQGKDLADLRRQVERGLRAAPAAGPVATTGPAGDDPFARIRAAEAMPGYASGDWLVDSGPNTNKLTPLVSFDTFAADVHSHVLQSLVQRDPVTLEYSGLLALPGWAAEDHVADYHAFVDPRVAKGAKAEDVAKDPACPCPIRITFHVRPNVTFSDGVPLTADDVAWSFDWIMNPAVAAPRERSALDKIRRAVRTGPDAVTFEFATPYFDAVGLAGGMQVMPRHFYQRYTPAQFNASTGLLMGSGPYKLADDPVANEWKPGRQVELVRNDHYWGEPPGLNRLVYRIITVDLARLTAFTNGELDQMLATPDQYQSLLDNADVAKRAAHYEYDTATSPYYYIGWNERRDGKPTHFADRRVRLALTLLTDRERICREVMRGLATVATGPFNRLGKQADPNVQPWPYDVDRAKALLKEAGYVQDGSGTLRGPDGQPFTIHMMYRTGSPTWDRLVLTLRDSYAAAGIAVEPEKLDWSVFKPKIDKRDFDAIAVGWSVGVEDDIYQMFDTAQIGDEGDNALSYSNPELDKLIQRARETLDPAVRMPLWHKCHDILHDDQPYTFLYTRKSTVFIANRIKNVQLLPLGLNALDEWFVPAGQQKYTH
jgi:peptide/nickel transport system substrate-binding protein